jgi:hypothetical protein
MEVVGYLRCSPQNCLGGEIGWNGKGVGGGLWRHSLFVVCFIYKYFETYHGVLCVSTCHIFYVMLCWVGLGWVRLG